MKHSNFQTDILTSYTWIINYRNVYGEWDWIIDDVKKLGGQIRYSLMTTSYGYHAITFHIKVPSMQSLHILKLKTDNYLNKQGWNSGDLNEYEKAETHIKFNDMRGRSGFKQIDRLRFLNFRNRRINKFQITKNILKLRWIRAYQEISALLEDKRQYTKSIENVKASATSHRKSDK